jgi:hypothetical protein
MSDANIQLIKLSFEKFGIDFTSGHVRKSPAGFCYSWGNSEAERQLKTGSKIAQEQ